jgi:hypothetical protein
MKKAKASDVPSVVGPRAVGVRALASCVSKRLGPRTKTGNAARRGVADGRKAVPAGDGRSWKLTG